jgi:hypothetical protein
VADHPSTNTAISHHEQAHCPLSPHVPEGRAQRPPCGRLPRRRARLTHIRYDAQIDDLNHDLAAAGLNITVVDQEPCYDMLYPGEPGY